MLAVLDRLSRLPGVDVERNRRAPVDGALDRPLLNLMDGGHTADTPDSSDALYSLQLLIDMTVPAETDAELGPALAGLYGRVLRCLQTDPATGATDFSLGGLCSDVRERGFDVRILPAEESAAPLAECSLDLLADFRTLDGNPYSL